MIDRESTDLASASYLARMDAELSDLDAMPTPSELYADELSPDEPCELCGGELVPLGMLGRRAHFRCRQCGGESSYVERDPAPQLARAGLAADGLPTGLPVSTAEFARSAEPSDEITCARCGYWTRLRWHDENCPRCGATL